MVLKSQDPWNSELIPPIPWDLLGGDGQRPAARERQVG